MPSRCHRAVVVVEDAPPPPELGLGNICGQRAGVAVATVEAEAGLSGRRNGEEGAALAGRDGVHCWAGAPHDEHLRRADCGRWPSAREPSDVLEASFCTHLRSGSSHCLGSEKMSRVGEAAHSVARCSRTNWFTSGRTLQPELETDRRALRRPPPGEQTDAEADRGRVGRGFAGTSLVVTSRTILLYSVCKLCKCALFFHMSSSFKVLLTCS